MERFADQVAIVTGGGAGIGEATCRRLAAEGARVVVADINAESASTVADRLGANAFAIQFDAGDVASVERLVQATIAKFGRLDILHNNAAITSAQVHAKDTDAVHVDFAVWDQVMAVNVRGYLAACKYALPHMITAGRGAIVNTASVTGLAGDVSRIAYGVSKAAIIGLTRQIATQHGAQGIRCNAVAPGLALSPAALAHGGPFIAVIQRHLLVREIGEPVDIANLVCFLASDEARYINGQTYVIDGGLLAHNPLNADLLDVTRVQSG